MNEHQENLLDHYSAPRNYGVPTFKANARAKLQNLSCGDEIEVFLKISKGKIKDVAFTGEGCSIAIGTASQLLEDVKGKEITKIISLNDSYPEELIGLFLTPSRRKCALLSFETIKEAINQYNKAIA